MKLPTSPLAPGSGDTRFTRDVRTWMNQVIDYLREITPSGDGRSILVKRSPQGTTISSLSAAGAGVVWAVVTSAGTGKGPHTVSIWTGGYYDDSGTVRDADLTGKTAYSPGLATGETILTGQPYLAAPFGTHYELLPDSARS